MILGHVRDGFPRITLALPGREGPLNVEFILDTAFDGDLALPDSVLSRLRATFIGDYPVMLADGRQSDQSTYEILLDWDNAQRVTQVIRLSKAPLLGAQLMDGKLLQAEMTDGGEVSLEDL